MRRSNWIEWTSTTLHPSEHEDLLATLTSDQKARLHDHDYVWVAGAGVVWIPVDGGMRRTRFTHGTHFRTRHGEFFIDSVGRARELPDPDETNQEKAA